MQFYGRTTAPWHIGLRKYGDYLYTRRDILWGRGIRGPVLRQLWRSYCPKSDLREAVEFRPERDCVACEMSDECPFNNLRGSGDGEFKDKPKLIITNLRFRSDFNPILLNISTISDSLKSVVKGRAPVFIECVPPDVEFEFEIILMGAGVRFKHEVLKAVDISLRFFGWGGFCNEGYGRGLIEKVEEHDLDAFEERCLKPYAEKLEGAVKASFTVKPILLIEKDGGGYYVNVLEKGFKERLMHSINERYWQFYSRHVYTPIFEVSGRARTVKIAGWSRKLGRRKVFTGIGNELVLSFRSLSNEEAKALALTRYGIGRFKNQGFGSLELKEVWR